LESSLWADVWQGQSVTPDAGEAETETETQAEIPASACSSLIRKVTHLHRLQERHGLLVLEQTGLVEGGTEVLVINSSIF